MNSRASNLRWCWIYAFVFVAGVWGAESDQKKKKEFEDITYGELTKAIKEKRVTLIDVNSLGRSAKPCRYSRVGFQTASFPSSRIKHASTV